MDSEDEPMGELKIKGQAEAERRRNKWDDDQDVSSPGGDDDDEKLQNRENELKERALRNKVVRNRQGSSAS